MMAVHRCDPSTDPRGGLVTLACVARAITTSNAAALTALNFNPDARMGWEMQLAAVQAAIDAGETETPEGGF